MKRRLIILAIALTAIVGSVACIIAAEDSSLTIYNDSSYPIYEIYVAEEFDPTYGPDLLGNDILLPGESLLVLLECGTYDVLVVDDIGTECELTGLSLCFDDAVWAIDDFDLATCGF